VVMLEAMPPPPSKIIDKVTVDFLNIVGTPILSTQLIIRVLMVMIVLYWFGKCKGKIYE
jgi:hypothetical protein